MSDRTHVTEQNNRGIILLQSKKYNDAIVAFRNAFDIVSKHIQNASESPPTKHALSLQWIRVGPPTTSCPSPLAHTKGQRPSPKKSSTKPSFIYRRALAIDKSLLASPTQAAAIVLFNLALSSHLLAISSQKAKKELLKMALTIYGRASNFLRLDASKECTEVSVFHLVSLNNVGLIYHELGNHAKATSCFSNVSSAMENLTMGAVDENEKKGIMLNIMTSKKGIVPAAA